MTDKTRKPNLETDLAEVRGRIGKTRLSDRDLLVLASAEIVRSFTREEKDYQAT